MGITEGKWIARPTALTSRTLRDGTEFNQATTIAISTKEEATFTGKNIATIDINVPDEVLTKRDGSPDELAILSNKCRYGLREAQAHAQLIADAPETAKQRDELLEALEKYGEHLGTCYTNLQMGECNCGLQQAIANATPKDDADLCGRLAKGDPPTV